MTPEMRDHVLAKKRAPVAIMTFAIRSSKRVVQRKFSIARHVPELENQRERELFVRAPLSEWFEARHVFLQA